MAKSSQQHGKPKLPARLILSPSTQSRPSSRRARFLMIDGWDQHRYGSRYLENTTSDAGILTGGLYQATQLDGFIRGRTQFGCGVIVAQPRRGFTSEDIAC